METVATYNANATPAVVGARTVDTSRGTNNSRVSSQFWNRPDDQRFLSLDDLEQHVRQARHESFATLVNVQDIQVRAKGDDPDTLRLVLPGQPLHGQGSTVGPDQHIVEPTHWSFGQLCSLVSVPAGYLRKLPATIAGINLQYGLANFREEAIKGYVRENGKTELRAATGPEYGRIFDDEVVAAVRRIAGDGVHDTKWKVPGVLDWGTMRYDPFAPVTKRTTTLFASDRDVFIFLVDDTHPIEIGKLASGEPDYVFRGFYVWNSEVGSRSLGVATMYLRATCCNRILWGVEGFSEITLRHSKGAPMRFAGEVQPSLESFSNASTGRLLTGIKAARDAIVARTDEQRAEFLEARGFTRPESKKIIESVLEEEHKPAESVWDFVQGITAVARNEQHQDERIAFERRASKLLEKVAA